MKWRRYPEDVLPMWVAEMDCRPAPEVIDAIDCALGIGDTGYPGDPIYPVAFADYAVDAWGWHLDPATQMVGLPDVMHGIVGILEHFTDAGAPVSVNPPVYPSFYEYLQWAGRPTLEARVTEEGRLDLAELERVFAGGEGPKPAAHLLCNPQNPQGTVHTADELAQVAELANRHGVLVISDEIHAPLTSRPARHVPYTAVPGGETGIVVTSASKAWNLAGLKAALAIGGAEVAPRLRTIPAQVAGGASYLGNIAHTAALTDARAWLDDVLAEIESNRDVLRAELARQLPAVRYRPGPATFLAWLDCRDLGLTNPAKAFCDRGRVAFNPGPAFGSGGAGFVRMNIGTAPELIREGVRRMAASVD